VRKLHIALRPIDIICLVILAALAVMIFATNLNTHLYAEGYLYSFKFNPGFVNGNPAQTYYQKIDSPDRYFNSLKDLYMNLTGRIVPHGLLQFLLLFDPWVFDLLNTLALLLLPLLMVLWVMGKERRQVIPYWLLCFSLFYLAVSDTIPNLYLPAYSINYVWTQIIVLCVLYPVRLQLTDSKPEENKIKVISMIFVLGLLAGDTNEVVIPGVLLAMGSYGLYMLIMRKRLPVWYYTAFWGMILGYLFLIIAPGNFQRVSLEPQSGSGIQMFTLNLQHLKSIIFMSLGTLPALLIAFVSVFRFKAPCRKEDWYPLVFLCIILGGIIFTLLFTPIMMSRLNILFVGFVIMICLYFMHYSRLSGPWFIMICFVMISPLLMLKMTADSHRMKMADREYDLFVSELSAVQSDSVLVSPRVFLDPLTGKNSARPLAIYHQKHYIWVKDVLDSASVTQMRSLSYRETKPNPRRGVELEKIGYLDLNDLSGTMYISLKQDEDLYDPADISFTVYRLNLDQPVLRKIYEKLPQRVAGLLMREEPMYRPYEYRRIGSTVLYAIPSRKMGDGIDYLRIRMTAKNIKVTDWYLQNIH